MIRISIAVGLALAALCYGAISAQAAAPTAKQFAALQAQVNRQADALRQIKRERAEEQRLADYCYGEATDLSSFLDYYVGGFIAGWLPLDEQRLGNYVLAVNPMCVKSFRDRTLTGDQRVLKTVPR